MQLATTILPPVSGKIAELFGAVNAGAQGACATADCKGCLLNCKSAIHCNVKGRSVLPLMTAYLLGEISNDEEQCRQCGHVCKPVT